MYEIRDALGIRKTGTLSTSSLEVLAIVAYNQPVTRAFVDTLRRVDSSYAMNNLIDRGLIECVGRLDVPGRPMQYGTTSDFLRCFGLASIEALPSASEELVNMFEKTREKEDAEREVDENQISINDLENENQGENSEQNADAIGSAGIETAQNEADSNEITVDDEPSAEDDIIDVD